MNRPKSLIANKNQIIQTDSSKKELSKTRPMTSKNCTFTVKTDRHEWSMTDKVEVTTQQFSEMVRNKSRTNKNLT